MNLRSVLAGVVVAGLMVTACGKSAAPGGNGGAAAPGQTVTLKLGHSQNAKHPWHLASLKFAQLVAQKTNNTVKVEVFSDGTLGTENDMAEGMKIGSRDMSVVGTGTLGVLEPKMDVFGLPYLFRDHDHLTKVLTGPIGQEVFDAMAKDASIHGLAYWERDPRHLTNSKRAVNTPADVKGLKLRTPPEDMSMSIWSAQGAVPQSMTFNEVFTALQQKVIDGQENPLSVIASAKLNEVQKYLTLTYHTWAPAVIAISDKAYAKLSPDQQKALVEAAKEASTYNTELVQQAQTDLLKQLQDKGMNVTKPDTTLFAAATKDVHLKFDSRYGKDLYEKIQAVK